MEFIRKTKIIREADTSLTYTVRELYLITPDRMRICEREVIGMRRDFGEEVRIERVDMRLLSTIKCPSFRADKNQLSEGSLPKGFNQKEVADATN